MHRLKITQVDHCRAPSPALSYYTYYRYRSSVHRGKGLVGLGMSGVDRAFRVYQIGKHSAPATLGRVISTGLLRSMFYAVSDHFIFTCLCLCSLDCLYCVSTASIVLL